MNKEQLIQKYLDHSLTDEEKILLENETSINPDFEKELEEAKNIRVAIIAHKKETLRTTFKKLENQKKPTFFSAIKYGIAACFVISIFTIAYFLFTVPSSNNTLFLENFEPYRNIIIPIERAAIPNQNKNKEYLAFYDYETGNYKTALLEFTSLYQTEEISYYLFYKAICELRLDQVDNAIDSFLTHQKLNDSFKEKGKWYLALAYLKNNDIPKCKIILEDIVKHKSYNYQKAKEILEVLTTN
ncbi:tol-pal system YbgF family protein [Flavobacterium sp. J27]|uniref:tetratricopeptide repeat protein n=1 Tax=Flavobacterium sp. J27 TaxID=2060419 RepID=UPI0010304C32|nr:hypothetical protein [Flavobacterium sp. J27]